MLEVQDIFQTIRDMIRPEYLQGSELKLKENKSGYYSITVTSLKTPYRINDTSNVLFAQIWDKKDSISFSKKYARLFKQSGIEYQVSESKSRSKFITIEASVFAPLSGYSKDLTKILNKIFIDLFSFPAFGCCSSYVECSDARHCIHTDPAYATACQYRANLESGRIFYGKNRNINEEIE